MRVLVLLSLAHACRGAKEKPTEAEKAWNKAQVDAMHDSWCVGARAETSAVCRQVVALQAATPQMPARDLNPKAFTAEVDEMHEAWCSEQLHDGDNHCVRWRRTRRTSNLPFGKGKRTHKEL